VFLQVVFSQLRRRARQLLGLESSQCGAVTFLQRFGDALRPHFHSIVSDGFDAAGADGQPKFHELPAPEDAEVVEVATQWSLILLCYSLAAAIGGGLYEHIVLTPMWSKSPPSSFSARGWNGTANFNANIALYSEYLSR